ncbi:hypothetical protein CANCADRAFT_13 [Tortispora caseinolytica NRRL Y-17796]|uniref:Uncharacterized protein n=1 Tax=Tortispora caseinolytica NRRL Y-17796 TaxID=767744 RepID=A0A1E4TI55_9ASCO|nr:hypothetical protein CANCADRAFT_13 [Tortispora caseinolytica NRRL Y-17796]
MDFGTSMCTPRQVPPEYYSSYAFESKSQTCTCSPFESDSHKRCLVHCHPKDSFGRNSFSVSRSGSVQHYSTRTRSIDLVIPASVMTRSPSISSATSTSTISDDECYEDEDPVYESIYTRDPHYIHSETPITVGLLGENYNRWWNGQETGAKRSA